MAEQPKLRRGAPLRWLDHSGVVLRVVEIDEDDRVYEVDLGHGVTAVAFERQLRPAYVN
jgi:hypothetical protein